MKQLQCIIPNMNTLSERDGKSPNLKVNDKQLQMANLVYIVDGIILSVNASKYGILPIIELTSFPL